MWSEPGGASEAPGRSVRSNRAVVGLGSCGVAAGARRVREALVRSLADAGLEVEVGITGCIGLCHREPLVELESPALGRCLYGDVTEAVVPALVAAHFREQRVLSEHLVWREAGDVPPVLARQERLVLRNCGRIDPGSLEDYVAGGGYRVLARVLAETEPDALIAEVEASGLRGRGLPHRPEVADGARRRRPRQGRDLQCGRG